MPDNKGWTIGTTLLALLACATVPGCSAAETTRPASPSMATTFSGRVVRGERFVRTIAKDLSFDLVPIAFGWEIVVRAPSRPDENVARLTPPFHFVPNPRYIEGWHFRNADNTGPNDGSVNAPQTERKFMFSPKLARSIQYPPGQEDVAIVQADGRGVLTIIELHLGNLIPGERAHIESMTFRVTVEGRSVQIAP